MKLNKEDKFWLKMYMILFIISILSLLISFKIL